MNKYSSKAIKTAATVGMSLAMVLSAVPAVGNATVAQAAITNVTSARNTATLAHKILAAVLDEVDYTDLYKDSTLTGTTIKVDSNYEVVIAAGNKLADLGDLTATLVAEDSKAGIAAGTAQYGIVDGTTLSDLAAYLVGNSYAMDADDIDEDVIAFAKYVDGFTKGTTKLAAYFEDGTWKQEGEDGSKADTADVTTIKTVALSGVTSNNAYNTAKAIYKILDDNSKYLNAVINEAGSDAILTTIENFKAEVDDYKAENEDVYNKDYVRALERVELVTDVTVYDAVEKNAFISYSDVTKVEKVLKNIKNNNIDALTTYAKYADVKDSDEVADYIEGIETIISEMKEVKTLLKDTNADVKSYKKDLAKKVNALALAVKNYLGITDDTTADNVASYELALDKALNNFREADATALKEFVEGYVGEFFTLTPKQLNSGKYVVRLEGADYGRYVTTTNVFDVIEKTANTTTAPGLQYLLTTVIDNEASEETYYDVLINTVTTVEELLKAVTTDIEGITMNSTLTDKQAAKIIAAKKALNQLVDDGKIDAEYASALTSKEKKEVLGNVDLIETLYFKLILNGSITASGWVDKGNGDWDYIAEDGSRPTKWIASGANWYYVKNGTMLRNSWIASDAQGTRWYYVDDAGVMVSNTTVNGYTFNSYGVWVK